MEVVREHCTKRKNGTAVDDVWEPLLAAFQASAFLLSFSLMLQYFVTTV